MTDRECKVNPISSRICEKGTKSCTVYHNDREKLCREFTELTGGHWHELVQVHPSEYNILTCVKCGENGCINPTYENPADVLRVMMERDDWDRFADEKIGYQPDLLATVFVSTDYFFDDKLLKAAVEFLKEAKK